MEKSPITRKQHLTLTSVVFEFFTGNEPPRLNVI